MAFTQSISSGFSNYVNFSGRSGRSEYWYWFLFYILASIAVSIIAGIIGAVISETIGGILPLLFALAIILPSLAVAVRRFHDIDKSGWWILISLIPLVGFLILIYFMVQPSDESENRFGPVPEPGIPS